MEQSKQVLNKLPNKREGRAKFFTAITSKIDTGLPALVVALCSNRLKSLGYFGERLKIFNSLYRDHCFGCFHVG